MSRAQEVPQLSIAAPHPRLLLPEGGEAALWKKIEANDFLRRVHRVILQRSDEFLTAPPLRRELTGRRLLSVSRAALTRIYYLSYSWRMTGDDRYAERARQELRNIAAFTDWNPTHFLDVAEMTMASAIGYDWLHDYLDDDTKALVRRAIREKALDESMPETTSDPSHIQFLKKKNNWNAVCNGSLAFGAAAVYEDHPALARRIIARSISLVRDVGSQEYQPHGNYPEGYSYWSYGTAFTVMFIDLLENLYGTSFGMTDNPGFMATPRYILQMTTPRLGTFAYSDCTIDFGISFPMFWFAGRTADPSLLWGEAQKLAWMDARGMSEADIFHVRFLPSVVLWAPGNALAGVEKPAERLYVGQGTTPVALMRNRWGDPDGIFVGLKGGQCLMNHAHMDIGSFVMYRGANQWIKDMGVQDYHSLEKYGLDLERQQGSDRWRALRFGKDLHNIMTFNGRDQIVHGKAHIDRSGDRPGFVYAISDLTAVDSPTVDRHRRGVAIVGDDRVVVRDEVVNGDHYTDLRWAALTPARVRIADDRTIELALDGEILTMRFEGEGIVLDTWSTAPRYSFDAENPGTTMVGFTAVLSPGETAGYTVSLIPREASSTRGLPELDRWDADPPFTEQDRALADRVAEWQIRNYSDTLAPAVGWVHAALYRGMVEWAPRSGTRSRRIDDFLTRIGEAHDWGMFGGRTYDADDLCVGQTYFELYDRTGDRRMIEKTMARVDSVISRPDTLPLMTAEGNYYRNRWGWCDALYMAPPVYARIARETGDDRYLDFCFSEFQVTVDSLYDRDDRLFYRDGRFVGDRDEKGRKIFWGRGNGWVYAGLTFLLELVPETHPSHAYYLKLYREMTGSILRTQDAGGSWHSSLYDAAGYPQPENSASGFFVYGLAWGVNRGVLTDPALRAAARNAARSGWSALKSHVDPDGRLGYIQPVGHRPATITPDMTMPYGAGALLLAAAEMSKME